MANSFHSTPRVDSRHLRVLTPLTAAAFRTRTCSFGLILPLFWSTLFFEYFFALCKYKLSFSSSLTISFDQSSRPGSSPGFLRPADWDGGGTLVWVSSPPRVLRLSVQMSSLEDAKSTDDNSDPLLDSPRSPSSSSRTIAYSPRMPMHMYPFYSAPSLIPNETDSRPKRRQVKNACTNCQKACKKCDDARPCLRCVKYGISEECVDSLRKERRKGVKRGPYKKRDLYGKGVCSSIFVLALLCSTITTRQIPLTTFLSPFFLRSRRQHYRSTRNNA